MKQAILQKSKIDLGKEWYDTEGRHVIKDRDELFERAETELYLNGIEDVYMVTKMKTSEDKKHWIVEYITEWEVRY